jgi:hypothetical protein
MDTFSTEFRTCCTCVPQTYRARSMPCPLIRYAASSLFCNYFRMFLCWLLPDSPWFLPHVFNSFPSTLYCILGSCAIAVYYIVTLAPPSESLGHQSRIANLPLTGTHRIIDLLEAFLKPHYLLGVLFPVIWYQDTPAILLLWIVSNCVTNRGTRLLPGGRFL